MADDKKDFMGGNSTRDGDAVRKIAKDVGIDVERLKLAVESEKKGGVNNLTYEEIKQIALALKRK